MIKKHLTLIAALALAILFFATTIRTSGDTFWHLSVGKQVWQTKAIPAQDTFVYGPEDKTFISVEWLSGLIYYLPNKAIGDKSIVLIRITTAIAIISVLYLNLKLITSNKLLTFAALQTAAYILAFRFKDRPEIFSYLLIAAVNYLCFYCLKAKSPRLVFLILPLLFLAWPNIHPSSLVGLAIPVIFTLSLILKAIKEHQFPTRLKIMIGATALSALAILAQFQRTFIFLNLSRLKQMDLTEFGTFFEELTRTKGYDFLNQISYQIYIFLALLILYAALTYTFLKSSKNDPAKALIFILYLGFFALPFKLFRLIPFSIIAILPPLVLLITETIENKTIFRQTTLAVLATICALILISIVNTNVAGNRENQIIYYFGPTKDQQRPVLVSNRIWHEEFPQNIAEIIQNHLQTKRLFTSAPLNNYFLWKVPSIQVFSDALFYNRSLKDYQDEETIISGGEGWQSLLEKYDIDTLVMPLNFFPLQTPVETLPNWKLIFIDRFTKLYAREDVIQSFPIDLSTIKPESFERLKYDPKNEETAIHQLENLLAYDQKNGFARPQLIEYYLSQDLTRAKKMALSSRSLITKDPIYPVYLARIFAIEKNCPQSLEFAKEAKSKSYNELFIKIELDDTSRLCPS